MALLFFFMKAERMKGLPICMIMLVLCGGVVPISSAFSQQLSTKEIIKIHLEVGDRFLAIKQYREARRDYEKALIAEPNNLEALHRLITLYTEVRGNQDYFLDYGQSDHPSSAFLNYLFRIYAIDSNLKNDVNLLLKEAQIHDQMDNEEAVESVLSKTFDLAPNDPVVLAELGRIEALIAKDSKDINKKQKAINLLKKAIDLDPTIKYQRYLADALRWFGEDTEAIREYMGILKRLKNDNSLLDFRHIDYGSFSAPMARRVIELFYKNLDRSGKGAKINFSLQLDPIEQVSTLELLCESKLWFLDSGTTSGTSVYPRRWLAQLYVKVGDYEKADQKFRKYMKFNNYDLHASQLRKEELVFWEEILLLGKHDTQKLREVQKAYEFRFGEAEVQPAKKQRR